MAKPRKRKYIVQRPVKIGLNKDGTPKKEYKKGDSIFLLESELINYKKNNII